MIPVDLEKLRIVCYPDPVLHQPCAAVQEFSEELAALAERMLVLMREAKGVGLAAPQVGVPLRLFVCNPRGEEGHQVICVNPALLDLSGADEKEEGCLSIPGVSVAMRRATRAVIEARDATGRPFRKIGVDLEARVWQHEIDHLDGRLIIDNMSATDEIANRRAVKQLEAQYHDRTRRRVGRATESRTRRL